jgi:hypothetical protein
VIDLQVVHDRRYRSFIVRVWNPGGGGALRVEIERIQSGTRTVLEGAVAERIVAAIDPDAGGEPMPGPPPDPVIGATERGRAS